jgi:hypothetical protein
VRKRAGGQRAAEVVALRTLAPHVGERRQRAGILDPSATTSRSSACLSSTVDRTIAALRGSTAICDTNERSILS